MSHGFTRFGQPPARERLHHRMRAPGTLSMLLPTIFATLFLFTVVVTLNKAGNMSRGGKIVRLMNVDDVFPNQEAVEKARKKEFWELTPPPPSPDDVLGAREALVPPVLVEEPVTMRASAPAGPPVATQWSSPRSSLAIETTEIRLPPVAPDTSLPVAAPTP